MKYIILEATNDDTTVVVPFVFPSWCVHAEVAKRMVHMLSRVHKFPYIQTVSAGTYNSADGELKSRPEDTNIIKLYDYAQGGDLPDGMVEKILRKLDNNKVLIEMINDFKEAGDTTTVYDLAEIGQKAIEIMS